MVADYTLNGNLTLDLSADETAVVRVLGTFARLGIETFIDDGGTYSIQSSNISIDAFAEVDSVDDIEFQDLQLGIVSKPSLDIDIHSYFFTPNYLYIKNLSTEDYSLNINIRSNK